jgi:hypothetical protein
MAQNECIPFYEPGAEITATAEEPVSGKTFAAISGSRPYGPGFSLTGTDTTGGNVQVKTAAVSGRIFGVFGFDQPVVGGKVTIIRAPGIVLPVVAGLAIASFEQVSVGAGGKAVPRVAAAGKEATGILGKIASNNSVLVTALAKDSSGDAIKVVIEPLGVSGVFGIVQVGNEFKVTLKTSAGKVAETTGTEIITKLNENAGFKALAKAANNGASTGAGLGEPGEVQLAGGIDEGLSYAVGYVLSAANEAEDAQVALY